MLNHGSEVSFNVNQGRREWSSMFGPVNGRKGKLCGNIITFRQIVESKQWNSYQLSRWGLTALPRQMTPVDHH